MPAASFATPEDAPISMIGTGQDITERRRVEEQRDQLLLEERRAGEFREAFIDVISHELRTPITTILGLTQILARPGRADDPASRAALLEDVRAESERLHRLVEDLLVLSRAERGRLVIDAEPLQPRRLIERIVAQEAPDLPSLHIETRLGPDLPVVAGEGTYVEQIVRNLLGNAAKYTPVGTKVVIDARRDDSVVEIRVTDDGPGIPDESLRRVFDLFYRDPDSARAVAGSGIGLFVCRSLVEAMGGRMWALRPPGGGSEFGFTLRVLEADELDAEEPDERHPVSLLEPFRRADQPGASSQRMTPMAAPAAISQPVPMPRSNSPNVASSVSAPTMSRTPPMASWTATTPSRPTAAALTPSRNARARTELRRRSRIGMLTATAKKAGRKTPTVAAAAPTGPPTT